VTLPTRGVPKIHHTQVTLLRTEMVTLAVYLPGFVHIPDSKA
jgi:hypothetical protein